MGTNFYLRRTKPVLCFPEFHIGKRSAGWMPLYQANRCSEDYYRLETQRPIVSVVDDIREAVDSGEWVIIDEYGTEFTFDEFIGYMEEPFPIEDGQKRQSHVEAWGEVYEGKDGREYVEREFS